MNWPSARTLVISDAQRGGREAGIVGMAALYEEMNRSIFGPVVFASGPPDDGKMILLEKIGADVQKDKWL